MPAPLRIAAFAFLCLAAGAAAAQADYPKGPIRLVVPFTPGGATDIVSRLVADRLASGGKWTFVIDNKPGAGGNIGLDIVAKSRPDGYTVGMGQTANMAINPALYAGLPYDPLKDLVPIALVAEQPLVVVVPGTSSVTTLAELVAAAKAKPLLMASAGNGTVGHLAGELFARRAGFAITHVPYKGAAAAITDLMGGRTDFMLPTPQAALPLVKSGRLRAVAVTSGKRLSILPEVPTVDESGYKGFVAIDWKALVAPAGTPPAFVAQLHDEIGKALRQPEMIDRMNAEGSGPMGGTLAEAAQFIRAEHERWSGVVRAANVKPD